MERLTIISHNSFRAIGFHKSKSPSSPYGPALQSADYVGLVFMEATLEKGIRIVEGFRVIFSFHCIGP